MHQREKSALADGQPKVLGGLAAVGFAKGAVVRENSDAAIGFFGDVPGEVGPSKESRSWAEAVVVRRQTASGTSRGFSRG